MNLGGDIFLLTVCWLGVSRSTGHACTGCSGLGMGLDLQLTVQMSQDLTGCVARKGKWLGEVHWNVVIEIQRKGLDTVSKSLPWASRGLCRASCAKPQDLFVCLFIWLFTYFFSSWLCLLVKPLVGKDMSLFTWRQRKQETCQLPWCPAMEILLHWVGARPWVILKVAC